MVVVEGRKVVSCGDGNRAGVFHCVPKLSELEHLGVVTAVTKGDQVGTGKAPRGEQVVEGGRLVNPRDGYVNGAGTTRGNPNLIAKAVL